MFTAPLQDLYGLIDARIEQLEARADTAEAAVEEEVAEKSLADETPERPRQQGLRTADAEKRNHAKPRNRDEDRGGDSNGR